MTDIVERLRRKQAFVRTGYAYDATLGIDPDCVEAADEIERLRAALIEIRDHWANQYDHPRKETEMYRGPYGIGVTDGHRACTIIAEKALALSPSERGSHD